MDGGYLSQIIFGFLLQGPCNRKMGDSRLELPVYFKSHLYLNNIIT